MPVRLFVGNLPYETSEADLRELFASIGPLSHVFLPVDRETGRPRGFAFVEFADRAQAEAAMARLNGHSFRNRTLSVSEARAREDRPAGSGWSGGGARPAAPGHGGGQRPEVGARPPRPAGGYGPVAPVAPPPERHRNFGPDAPKRGAKAKYTRRREEGPKGPIRIKGGGRIYDVDDFDDTGNDEDLFEAAFGPAEPEDPDDESRS